MGFDLAANNLSKNCDAGYEFELDYLGEATGAFVKVLGNESKVVKAYNRKKLAEFDQRKKAAERKGKEDVFTSEDAEDLAVESALVRLVSWRGLSDGDKEIVFSKENAEVVLREHPWIREQILKEATELTNFR